MENFHGKSLNSNLGTPIMKTMEWSKKMSNNWVILLISHDGFFLSSYPNALLRRISTLFSSVVNSGIGFRFFILKANKTHLIEYYT